MANQTKAETAAALLAAGISRKAYSIPEFCARNGIFEGFYRKSASTAWARARPVSLTASIITEDAEADWRREREATSAESDTPHLKQRA